MAKFNAKEANRLVKELTKHLIDAHNFIENTEAFGKEASNGILVCAGSEWNIDKSKEVLNFSTRGKYGRS